MPPVQSADTFPKFLRPYRFHGVELDHQEGRENAPGPCFLCGSEDKFGVLVRDGQWKCFVCGKSGNIYTFLRELWRESDKRTNGQTKVLAADRRLLYPETLHHWGVVKSVTTGDWLIPGYSSDRKMNNLYKYALNRQTKKYQTYATSELGHCLFGANLLDPDCRDVYVCEGQWDGIALWEVLRCAKRADDGSLALTGNPEASLLGAGKVGVVAVPGASSFRDDWVRLLAGKRVFLMYDSDHPKTADSAQAPMIGASGYDGMVRAARVMARAEAPPAEVHYLDWSGDGRGFDPKLPSGFDVRDMLTSGADDVHGRIRNLQRLLAMTTPVPADWIPGRTREAARKGAPNVEIAPCTDWKTLVNAWRRTLRWPEPGLGLDNALAASFASIISTTAVGDQLWIKMVGPPACGKSTLCEAMSVNKKYVLAKSTIRGFHSGYDQTGRGEEDNSLLGLLKNKTLVTKDGDTLLQSPNLGQILSEARDVYDRVSRTHYRNKTSKDYEGISATWILCGTNSLRALDSSELGERFLDVVIAETIDEDEEDEVALRVAYRAGRDISLLADGSAESQDGPEMVLAKQLTGGYIQHLRENSQELLSAVTLTDEAYRVCTRLGKFVAFMRARPSIKSPPCGASIPGRRCRVTKS